MVHSWKVPLFRPAQQNATPPVCSGQDDVTVGMSQTLPPCHRVHGPRDDEWTLVPFISFNISVTVSTFRMAVGSIPTRRSIIAPIAQWQSVRLQMLSFATNCLSLGSAVAHSYMYTAPHTSFSHRCRMMRNQISNAAFSKMKVARLGTSPNSFTILTNNDEVMLQRTVQYQGFVEIEKANRKFCWSLL
jgi:hypothetical protein